MSSRDTSAACAAFQPTVIDMSKAGAIAVSALILLYPILELLRTAFTSTRAPGSAYSYTFDAFRTLLGDPQFYSMLGVTFVFVTTSVLLQVGVGLLLAWLFDAADRRRVRGSLAARVAVVGAWVVPGVLVGVL